MIFRAYQPVFPLDHFIENLIYTEGFSAPHSLDRFLPDGNTEIIIDLSERSQYIYNNESLQAIQTCRFAWVSGIRTRPITIPSGNGSRMLIIAFKRGRAFPFYPFPTDDLTDTVVHRQRLVYAYPRVDRLRQLGTHERARPVRDGGPDTVERQTFEGRFTDFHEAQV